MLTKELKTRIDRMMQITGTTQTDLAIYFRVSRQHISAILNLKHSSLRIEEELEEIVEEWEEEYKDILTVSID